MNDYSIRAAAEDARDQLKNSEWREVLNASLKLLVYANLGTDCHKDSAEYGITVALDYAVYLLDLILDEKYVYAEEKGEDSSADNAPSESDDEGSDISSAELSSALIRAALGSVLGARNP